jgi:hypothetical protein
VSADYRKFGLNDIRINTLKAHPRSEFFIYKGEIFYNDQGRQLGQWQTASATPGNAYMTKTGYVNLYEYNIDRDAAPLEGVDRRALIYPYISKDSSRVSLVLTGTYGDDTILNEFAYGDIVSGSYPLKTTIRREFVTGATSEGFKKCISSNPADLSTCHDHDSRATAKGTCNNNMTYYSLRNILDLYSTLSIHYKPKSKYGDKNNQPLNIIHIPSIFYGDKIKPGTVSLKWYYTGSLLAEVRDTKENGELIQVGPTGSLNEGLVQGVILYNEGFVILTGSRRLGKPSNYPPTIGLDSAGTSIKPSWKYWGAGARDGVNTSTAAAGFVDASFRMDFQGTTKTEVVTMYAHAKRGEVNYSNNPTFLQYNQPVLSFTSSHVYAENTDRKIKNTKSSSFKDYKEEFERQVYISKIAVYDKDRNLIGIATLPSPILKEEDRDLAFKLKLDI